MDSSPTAPPTKAQLAVKRAAAVLAHARQVLAAKQGIADRANRHSDAAALQADRLQAKMTDVKYAQHHVA